MQTIDPLFPFPPPPFPLLPLGPSTGVRLRPILANRRAALRPHPRRHLPQRLLLGLRLLEGRRPVLHVLALPLGGRHLLYLLRTVHWYASIQSKRHELIIEPCTATCIVHAVPFDTRVPRSRVP